MTEQAMVPNQEAWAAWNPWELRSRLAGVDRPWCVVGGWALDLWHGRQTRPHEDLEFTILRQDLELFRGALNGLDLYTVHDGQVSALPSGVEPAPGTAQIWCFEPGSACWRADMMIEPGTPETWICKRDARITRPRDDIMTTSPDGIPYLGPAAVLLFKAKYRRPKDEDDFNRACPRLPAVERAWLAACLELIHPGHDWLRAL